MLLKHQTQLIELWYRAGDRLTERSDRDRGEVTATTALIFLLVTAAIAAGVVIADKIVSNADTVPSP